MSTSLQPNRKQILALSAVYLILGFVLTFFSSTVLFGTVRILGGLMFLYGLYQLFAYFTRNSRSVASLIYGLPVGLIGLFILISPTTLISIFPIVIGIILLISSIIQMQKAFIIKKAGLKGWFASFAIALLLMIAGFVLILRPVAIMGYLLKIAGVFLMAEGAFTLFEGIQLNSINMAHSH